jgi:nucleoside-diphosphate-sugar epimerase
MNQTTSSIASIGPPDLVLVTGATGFLGTALTRRLSGLGCRIKALVRSPEKAGALRALPGVELMVGDVTDAACVAAAARDCTYVFHAAAAMKGNLELRREVNVEGTRAVMNAAAEAGVKRVVHVSTIGVYGLDVSGDVSESMGPRPARDPYTISKAEGEAAVRQIGEARKVSYAIVRPGNIYGPGSTFWTASMFKLVRRGVVFFPGDGRGTNPLIHVDDLIDLLLVCAVAPAAHREAFNATPDHSPSWRDLLLAYAALAGHQRWLAIPLWPLQILARLIAFVSPKSSAGTEMPGLLRFMTSAESHYRNQKARQLLGWQPQVALADGVRQSAPWLRGRGLLA